MSSGFDILDSDNESIELTPIIDVLFLLLTFFILAATFAAPSIDVTLAEADSASAVQSQVERITFSIDAEGTLHYEKNPIAVEDIDALLFDKPLDIAIIFNVDADAPFNAFVATLDRVKVSGYHNFMINAQQKQQSE